MVSLLGHGLGLDRGGIISGGGVVLEEEEEEEEHDITVSLLSTTQYRGE